VAACVSRYSVGVSSKVLELILAICQTCAICREWAQPGPDNFRSAEFADAFNSQVECDLLSVRKYMIFRMIDRYARWHAAKLIESKDEDTLMTAIADLWIAIHGAPREFIIDGEGGIVASEKTHQHLDRKGTKIHPRAKDQRARFIERRGALVRDAIHKIESQIREEGLAGMPFSSILAEAVFAGNVLLSVNGSTPCNAVCGSVPRIRPSIDQVDALDEAHMPAPGLIRHTRIACAK
jgi:hypothetical protein